MIPKYLVNLEFLVFLIPRMTQIDPDQVRQTRKCNFGDENRNTEISEFEQNLSGFFFLVNLLASF